MNPDRILDTISNTKDAIERMLGMMILKLLKMDIKFEYCTIHPFKV